MCFHKALLCKTWEVKKLLQGILLHKCVNPQVLILCANSLVCRRSAQEFVGLCNYMNSHSGSSFFFLPMLCSVKPCEKTQGPTTPASSICTGAIQNCHRPGNSLTVTALVHVNYSVCPTSRLDEMSLLVDCILHTHKMCMFCHDSIYYTVRFIVTRLKHTINQRHHVKFQSWAEYSYAVSTKYSIFITLEQPTLAICTIPNRQSHCAATPI